MSTTLTAKRTTPSSRQLEINGELVILGADGRLSFDALQQRLVTSPAKARAKAAQLPAAYAAFDLLAIGGVDLRTPAVDSSPPAPRATGRRLGAATATDPGHQ